MRLMVPPCGLGEPCWNICMQVGLDVLKREVNGYVGDEDCLYLNVRAQIMQNAEWPSYRKSLR